MRTSLVSFLLCPGFATGLLLPAGVRGGNTVVGRGARMMADGQCAVIELEGTEPVLLAKTLRKAWLEAGVKRGLTGSVLIPESGEGKVQIVASGDLERVKSFASWCGKQLGTSATNVEVVDIDACPTVPSMTSKFEVADMPTGKANAPWAQLLSSAVVDIDGPGKSISSDEGLA